MKQMIKRIIVILIISVVVLNDSRYNVWKVEQVYAQENYNLDENISTCYEDVMEKIDNDMNITDDEIEIINSMYENLEVNIPTEEIVWEVDHEKNQGIDSQVSTYTYVVDIALVRGTATEINGVSNFETAISSLYTNGNVNYDFVDDGHISFTIPGMKKTYLNAELCIDMIPQGITNYDGYLFLTAYCGAKEHNSVIFVFDSTTKKFITTMMMSECIHAGGITYANGYLWICDTYIDPETNEKIGKLYYYNYSHIKEALEKIVENNSVSTNTKITSVAMRFFDKGSVELGNGHVTKKCSKCTFLC